MTKMLVSCLWSAACLAATTMLLPAQAAPPAPGGAVARSKKADAAKDRVEVTFAEVIAMLKDDDLTAEEREKAIHKLQSIVERLRKDKENDKKDKGDAVRVLANDDVTVVAPKGTQVLRVDDGKLVVETGEGDTKTVRVQGGNVAVESADPQDPVAPAKPRTPKAPKPPKAAKTTKVSEHDEPQEAAPPARLRTFRAMAEAERAHAEAEKHHAEAEKHHVEAKKAHEDMARRFHEQHAKAEAEQAHAADEWVRAAARLHRDADRVRNEALRATEAGRLYRAHVLNEDGAAHEVRVRRKARDDDDDDAEIRAMIEEMRKEMREIRDLMRQIKAQATHSMGERAGSQDMAPRAAAGMGGFGQSRAFRGAAGMGGGQADAPRATMGTSLFGQDAASNTTMRSRGGVSTYGLMGGQSSRASAPSQGSGDVYTTRKRVR